MSDTRHIVLIVEDCTESVAPLEIALQKRFECIVELAGDGKQAVAAFNERPESILAIITDLHLPDIDGWEVIREIRNTALGKRLPIIAMSADPNPLAKVKALQSGADIFLSKPYSPFEMCRCLEGIMHENKNLDSTVDTADRDISPGE